MEVGSFWIRGDMMIVGFGYMLDDLFWICGAFQP